MVTKQYRSEKETVIEALEDIESFISKMDLFKVAYPSYSYQVDINPNSNKRSKNKWVVDLKVIKDEKQEDIKLTKGTT